MDTLKITKDNLNQYTNTELHFEGHIELEGKLGYVPFKSLLAKGYIFAEAGTGIEAGWGIKAGKGIKAGLGIKAGSGIEAGLGIKAG